MEGNSFSGNVRHVSTCTPPSSCGRRTLRPRPRRIQGTMIEEAYLRRRPQHRSLLSQQRRHARCGAGEQPPISQMGPKADIGPGGGAPFGCPPKHTKY
jgi:hypothetical protein